jgi:hypothetical protein
MRNSVFDFAAEVDRQISTLTREQFYLRRGTAKRLLEELYPLSRLALRLKYPGNDPEVEAFENDGPLDGVIHWGGVHASQLNVEVTYVHSYPKALRDELLFATGSTPGAGPIYRDKKTGNIVATSAIVPTDEEITQLAVAIVERFKKKRAKPYPSGTALLIAFDDPTFWGSDLWGQLITSISTQGGLEGGFEEVHIFNCGSNELQAF